MIMVVHSNIRNRDFVIDHKFSMGLDLSRPQANLTYFIFVSWKSFSLYKMKDMTKDHVGIILYHQEMSFSYPERCLLSLHQCMCLTSSYLNWYNWAYSRKAKTFLEHLILGAFYYLIEMGMT